MRAGRKVSRDFDLILRCRHRMEVDAQMVSLSRHVVRRLAAGGGDRHDAGGKLELFFPDANEPVIIVQVDRVRGGAIDGLEVFPVQRKAPGDLDRRESARRPAKQ